jgi:hypothetical protein
MNVLVAWGRELKEEMIHAGSGEQKQERGDGKSASLVSERCHIEDSHTWPADGIAGSRPSRLESDESKMNPRVGSLFDFHNPLSNCMFNQSREGVNSQLHHQPTPVGFDGSVGDPETFRDVFGFQSLGDQL